MRSMKELHFAYNTCVQTLQLINDFTSMVRLAYIRTKWKPSGTFQSANSMLGPTFEIKSIHDHHHVKNLIFFLKKMLGPSKSWTYYNTARPPLMETCHQVTHKYHNKVTDACYDPFRSWALNHRMINVHILRRTMSNYTSLDSSNENSFHAWGILFYWTDDSTNLFFRYFVINEIYNLYIFFFVAKLMLYSFNSFRIIFY